MVISGVWRFAPCSQPLRNATYSTMSYTPHTVEYLGESGEGAIHSYDLLHDALAWRNAGFPPPDVLHWRNGFPPAEQYHTKLIGGVLTVSKGVYVVATVHGVTSAVHLSNIYYLFKVYQYEPAKWAAYLKDNGVPTIVD
jgi:hypothetical protein